MSLDVSQLHGTSQGVSPLSSFFRAFRRLGAEREAPDEALVTVADNLSAPFDPAPSRLQQLVERLRAAARAQGLQAVAQADAFWVVAALRARKGDVDRALALCANYVGWRLAMDAMEVDACRSGRLREQLERGVIFVAGNTDRDGRPVINLRMCRQDPSLFSAYDSLRMISFVLEWTLRTFPAAQTHGIVMVHSMRDVALRNIDLRMPNVIQKAFSKTIPVRLAALHVCHLPVFMRAVFGLVSRVMGDKLKARIRVFAKGDEKAFGQFFDRDHIMEDLDMNGTATWTPEQHKAWIQRMLEDCQTWGPITAYEESGDKS